MTVLDMDGGESNPNGIKRHRVSFNSVTHDELSNEDKRDDDTPKRKRNRPTLSCTECKRRKIKCDRKIPCRSCLNRGQPSLCYRKVYTNTNIPSPIITATTHSGINTSTTSPDQSLINNPATTEEEVSGQQNVEDAARVLEELAGRAPRFGHADHSNSDSATPLDNTRLSKTRTSLTALGAQKHNKYLNSFTLSVPPLPLSASSPPFTISSVVRTLPSRQIVDISVRAYLADGEPFSPILFKPIFFAEYDEFWKIAESDPKFEIDPAWASVLYMVCAKGLLFCNPADPSTSTVDPDKHYQLYEAAINVLKRADSSRRPQFRACQASILICHYLKTCGHLFTPDWFSWLAYGIRIAQILGYHNLGSDPDTMPRDDPALPTGCNSVKREMAKGLWWQLVHLDDLQTFIRNHPTYIMPVRIGSTNLPMNINYDELSMDSITRVGKPDYVYTSASPSLFAIKLLTLHKEVCERRSRNDLPYDKVVEYDRRFRDIENNTLSAMDTHSVEEESNQTMFNQRFSTKAVVHRLLTHLHLPYFVRGYEDPHFASSKDSCVLSSRTIIVSFWQMRKLKNKLQLNTSSSILAASLVLFLDIFNAMDKNQAEEELLEKEDTLRKAITILENIYDNLNPNFKESAKMPKELIKGLMDDYEHRRGCKKSPEGNKSIPNGRPRRMSEPIWSVFQKVSKTNKSNSVNSRESTQSSSDGLGSVSPPQENIDQYPPNLDSVSTDMSSLLMTPWDFGGVPSFPNLSDDNMQLDSSLVDLISELNGDLNSSLTTPKLDCRNINDLVN